MKSAEREALGSVSAESAARDLRMTATASKVESSAIADGQAEALVGALCLQTQEANCPGW